MSVGLNADSRLEVFHIGKDNYLYNNWQTSVNGNWSGWNSREVGPVEQALCVGRNGDLRLEVFTLDSAGNMWHTWQDAPSHGPWGIENMGGATVGVHLETLSFKSGWWYRE